uniref:GAE domain-containing protein n=1 Tax=Romanomermis culicivorax TaxID=13658 RepID=A0A915I632_ROMCU
MSGYSPEHDVTGISDPFLQVKILKLLKLLGKNDYECSETMNDILAQVATNTESSKNVGNAILYETVQTIMDIQSESGLRVLAWDNWYRGMIGIVERYVALNTLLGTVNVDNTAVQRHRTTIVDCLKDPDVSIKRRSVELCFALMNGTNIRSMSKEIISFMEFVEPEFKAICSSNIFSPDRKWHFDTMLKVLKVAGNYVPDDVVSSMIQMLSENIEYQGYAALELYRAVKEDQTAAQPLQQVACWCIGEFGDLLVTGNVRIGDDQTSSSVDVSESEIVQAFERILISSLSTPTTKQYALTSAAKLSARFSTEQNEALKRLIQVHSTSVNLELQQRSVEFGQLFNNKEKLRHDLLERMPVITSKSLHTAVGPMDNGDGKLDQDTSAVHASKSSDDLYDLYDVNQTSSMTVDQMTTNKKFFQPSAAQNDLLGLLNEVTSKPATTTISPVNGFNAKTYQHSADVDLFGLLDVSSTRTCICPGDGAIPTRITLIPYFLSFPTNPSIRQLITENDNKQLSITLSATNSTPNAMESFVFQAAVTKAFQIQMLPPSSSAIKPLNSEKLTQVMKVHRISPGQALTC